MIFKQVQQVLDGTKTQTRRPVKPHEYNTPYSGDPELVLPIQRVWDIRHKVKWVIGRTYAVQPGRGKKAVGRIRITKIRREAVQSISEADCLAEGIAHRKYIQNPMQKWSGYYVPDDRVLTEPMICGHAYARICYQVLWNSIHRKPYRWEDNPEVWALDFERSER